MKNILIITTVSGFLNKFEKDNVRILIDMGYTVHYAANMKEQIYLYDESEITSMGVKLHHIDIAKSPYMLRDNIKAYHQIVDLVRQYNIQVIHCHTPVGGLLGRLAGRHLRKENLRVIYTAHGFHFYKGAPLINNTIYYAIEKLMAPYTDIMILINREDYENACKFHLKKGGRVYQIPGVGLDRQKFSPLSYEEIQENRKQLGIKEDDFFIVSVGELNENKNQEIVLKALAFMRDSGKDISHIKYGVCGDGFYHDKLVQWIKDYRLEDTVTMYGYCKEVWKILGSAQVSVFPSKREGLGMAALESLSMGIPVIAADNRGTREYMEHGKNGCVCRYNDAEAFARSIDKMMNMDPERFEKMKLYSRKSTEPFEKSKTNQQMRKIYGTLDERTNTQKITVENKNYNSI